MWIAWLIGIFLNLIAFILWYCTTTYESDYTERQPINIILFIAMILLSITPIANIIFGLGWAIWILLCIAEDDLQFKWPINWMNKTIK